MTYPKVQSAKAIDDHTLLIQFDNDARKSYDITPLFEKEMFLPLKNSAFFYNVQVDETRFFGMRISTLANTSFGHTEN
jgi:hypothetical protein